MREQSNDFDVERDVKVVTRDGVALMTDVYHPVGVDNAPTILERTAYGRAAISMLGAGQAFAQRGYRYVIQACRGTDGSGGAHSFFSEAADGRDAADWIAAQGWFNGSLGSYGMSYMGYTQWALASTRPPHLRAMVVALATTDRTFSWFTGGSLALEVMIPWNLGALEFNRPARPGVPDGASQEQAARRMADLRPAFDHLPLGDVLRHVAGEDLPLYQQQLAHPSSDDPFWGPLQHRSMLAEWNVPILLIEGWQDYPLPGVLDDYRALDAADVGVWLRIGPGGHLGGGGEGALVDAPLEWFDNHLRDNPKTGRDRRVTLYIQGTSPGWCELPDWPPASDLTDWHLHPDGVLSGDIPPPSIPDEQVYDPTDPTPSVGGIGMLTGGVADNASLEARPDVLVYTSTALTGPLLITGEVRASIELTTTCDHTDVFVRLCDVHPDGRSFNVCDGLRRFTPELIQRDAGGVFVADVPLWPTAYRFGAGHRIRVQISGGAHPVYACNLGTGEPPAIATEMRAATRRIFHDPTHPSRIVLPHARAS